MTSELPSSLKMLALFAASTLLNDLVIKTNNGFALLSIYIIKGMLLVPIRERYLFLAITKRHQVMPALH